MKPKAINMPEELWQFFLERCRNEKTSGSSKIRELIENYLGIKRVVKTEMIDTKTNEVIKFVPKTENKDSTEVRQGGAQGGETLSPTNTFQPSV